MNGLRKFIISEHISVEVEENREYIRVGSKSLFCTNFIYILPEKYNNKNGIYYTIDEIAEEYGYIRDRSNRDDVFFVVCSNLQAWVENHYNTDLYVYYKAFPILIELVKLKGRGSEWIIAKEVFRKMSGRFFPVKKYLINDKYLTYLNYTQVKEFMNTHYGQFLSELELNSEMSEVQKFVLNFELLTQCHTYPKFPPLIEKRSLAVKTGLNTGDYDIFFYLMEKEIFYDLNLYFTEEEEYWSFLMEVNPQFFRNVIGSTHLEIQYEGEYIVNDEDDSVKRHSIDLLDSLNIHNFSDALELQIKLKILKEQNKNLRDVKETYDVKLIKQFIDNWAKAIKYY